MLHFIAITLLLVLSVPVHAARLALVIGNAAYNDGPLRNPVNDARAMDQKLTTLGFKVQRIENLKRQQIGRTITTFANTVRAGDDVVVFYAGHSVQVKGVNYLPAVDADIQSEEDVALNSLNLNALMERLDEAKAGLKIMFLDACRNNPYARSFRSGERGLARVGAAPSGTLIHFATRPGSVAADGAGANGLYTDQLLRYIDSPNMPVEIMLKRVSAAVDSASQGAQEPWTEGSIRGDFYFKSSTGTQLASIQAESAQQLIQQSTSNIVTSEKPANSLSLSTEKTVAFVNKKAIPMARLEALEQQVNRSGKSITPEVKVQIKDEVIAREIFIQEALKIGLDTTEDFKTQMDLARQTILIRDLFAQFDKHNPAQDQTQKQKKLVDYQQLLRSNAKVTHPAPGSNNGVVAFVNGKAIPTARIDALAQQVSRSGKSITPEVKIQIKDEVIAREIFIQEALKIGLDTTEDFKTQMDLARQTILIREFFAAYQKLNPTTEAEVVAEYDRFATSNSGKESPTLETVKSDVMKQLQQQKLVKYQAELRAIAKVVYVNE